MKVPRVAKAVFVVGMGLRSLLMSVSTLQERIQVVVPTQPSVSIESNPFDNVNNDTTWVKQASSSIDGRDRPPITPLSRMLSEMKKHTYEKRPQHYGSWDSSRTKSSNHNISIIVELTGELGNHLHHIAHGRVVQTLLWQDYGVASHLVLRRSSKGEKYKRTQRQLQKCFPKLRALDFHGPQSSSLPSQKTLDSIQEQVLGKDSSQSLILHGGSTLDDTRQTVGKLSELLNSSIAQNLSLSSSINASEVSSRVRGMFIPFVRTGSMINRDMMDKFYDDFRDFFQFDEDACCPTAELPLPEVPVFHFRNFLGELKKGKKTGLEELSAQKVATELFANSTAKSIAIATRFPGRRASLEYSNALQEQGIEPYWLTRNYENSPPSAMQDFCAMRRTEELVGMVRSTFVVWAALLGNKDGAARLYSVDSTWTREKFGKNGKPIFRTYNWTHPELKRRIHFELYESEDLTARSVL